MTDSAVVSRHANHRSRNATPRSSRLVPPEIQRFQLDKIFLLKCSLLATTPLPRCDSGVLLSACLYVCPQAYLRNYRSDLQYCAAYCILFFFVFFSRSLADRCPVWARGRCRISPPRFLAECCKRQLNQVCLVLLYFRLSAFPDLY